MFIFINQFVKQANNSSVAFKKRQNQIVQIIPRRCTNDKPTIMYNNQKTH